MYDTRAVIQVVNSVEYEDGNIKAVVTTSHYGRVTTKPYKFSLEEWAEIIERGYINE